MPGSVCASSTPHDGVPVVTVSCASDPGRSRLVNEDRLSVDTEHGVYVIADGMGAMHESGAAADHVVSAVTRAVGSGDAFTGSSVEADLIAMIREADADVTKRFGEGRSGSTALVGHLVESSLYVAHSGDSSVIRRRGGVLETLTVDHNLAAIFVEAGQITADEARTHPSSSRLTSFVGMGEALVVDAACHETIPGDIYIFTSDGLTTMLGIGQISDVLRHAVDSPAEALCAAAVEAGGLDNIAIIVLELS